MKHLILSAFDRNRTTLLLFAFFVISGLFSYLNIPKESYPDVQIPILYTVVKHDGISPDDAERLLVKPVEKEVRDIKGIKTIKSRAYEGGANVIIEFHADTDITKARNDLRDKLNTAKTKFPDQTKEPSIHEFNFGQLPVLTLKLSGNAPFRCLITLARNLKDSIETSIQSVLNVDLIGDRKDVVEILLHPVQQERYSLVCSTLQQFFKRQNTIVPAGKLQKRRGAFSIKTDGLLDTVHDIQDLPLIVDVDQTVKLKDIADIRRTFKEPTSLAFNRINISESASTLILEISKRSNTNLIETIEAVKKLVSQIQKNWPEHISVSYINDGSKHVKDMLNDLQNNIITAILLVMVVIVLSLGWRSSLLISLSVPGSFLMGIFILDCLGYTINIVILFSLIFSVGMLVDGAIIVIEYADKKLEEGSSPFTAFREAAIRMAWPIITSISTILCVFAPLVFWPGLVGKFMRFMPITLFAVLGSSIVISVVFLPVLACLVKKKETEKQYIDKFFHKFIKLYENLLKQALCYPKHILWGAVLILIFVKLAHSFFGKGIEFFPDVEPDSVFIHIHARGNLSIYEKADIIRQVEKKILDMREFDSIYSRIGEQPWYIQNQIANDVIGSIILEFRDWKERRKVDAILKDVDKRINSIPGVVLEVVKNKKGPTGNKPLNIEIKGNDYQRLITDTRKIRNIVSSINGLINTEDSLPIKEIEWQVNVNRVQAMKLGCDITEVGSIIQMLTGGMKVSSYRPSEVNDEVDIVLRFLPQFRNLTHLNNLRINTPNGLVSLSSFANWAPRQKIESIDRVDGHRVFSIKADLVSGVLLINKVNEIKKMIKISNIAPDTKI
ncbi:MAG: efflux RND transporter permease subunit, partial [Alphaproteobacteria bacterium]